MFFVERQQIPAGIQNTGENRLSIFATVLYEHSPLYRFCCKLHEMERNLKLHIQSWCRFFKNYFCFNLITKYYPFIT